MNLAALSLLWIGRPNGPKPKIGNINPQEEQRGIQNLLKNELGFNENQINQYFQSRDEHRQKAIKIDREIDNLKRVMFNQVLDTLAKPVLSDSLLTLIQAKQTELEHITYQHFVFLKNLCGPEQKEKLRILMREVFKQKQPLLDGKGLPPPPQGGEEPPIPPR